MALPDGTRVGPYVITAPLGAGGMGEVYRARDTKLQRDVALKTLPDSFAADPERLARFEREARTLASLNHPQIAQIYGFEQTPSTSSGQAPVLALVMELVDGEDLSQRIGRGAIPLDEALPMARQIAEALEAAHEAGIIHRDLKPANIKVRGDGTVKVLDFGLAKTLDGSGGSGGDEVLNSPTITTPAMTMAGMILGTAAYMAPEQAKGKPADRRSDLWAFGCVLYEMLTAKRAFEGSDVSDTLAAILRAEPDWSRLPAKTPPTLQRLLRRALTKERKQRVGDATVLRLDIDDAIAEIRNPHASVPSVSRGHTMLFVIALAMIVVAIAIAGSVMARRSRVQEAPELRVDIVTPPVREATSLALSPDGEQILFVAEYERRQMIWVRELRTGVARPIEGTVDGVGPFWSPTNKAFAFFVAGRLKRLELEGGPARDLGSAAGARTGGTWNQNGTIVYAPSGSGLWQVSEDGGDVTPLTTPVPPYAAHRFPHFLPDGNRFLFFASGPTNDAGIFVGSLDQAPPRKLLAADAAAVYAAGHVFFVRNATLYAQAFDPETLALSGDAIRLTDRILFAAGSTALTTSTNGTIAFRTGSADRRQLTWFGRKGQQLLALGEPDSSFLLTPALSPDGRRIVVTRIVENQRDLWVFDSERALLTRLTTNGISSQAAWSPDGLRLAFVRVNNGYPDLFVRSASPGREDELLYTSDELKGITQWTRDDLLIFNAARNAPADIWAMSLADRKPFVVVKSDADEQDAQVSPDGKWIAYHSNRSGTYEIYVQPFRSAGAAEQVSTAGGAEVRWRADGKELFYIDFDERLVAVPVTYAPDRKSLSLGKAEPLFRLRMPNGTLQPGGTHAQYLPSSDGQRFLVNTLLTSDTASPITLLLNWRGAR